MTTKTLAILAGATLGLFRVTNQGATPNSGFYFRANPPADDVNDEPGLGLQGARRVGTASH